MKHWILAAMAALLAGCGTLRPDRPEPLADYLPETYAEAGGEAVLTEAWWHSFGSGELNRLLDEALAGNLTIAQYSARLRQQQALAAKANAGKIPSVAGTASAGTTWPDVTENSRTEAYGLGLTASYELDLWGRVRSTAQAALLNRDASRQDLQSAMMTLSANIAQTWLSIIAQQTKLDLLHRQLEANTQVLELLQLRQRNAISTALDVLQQRQIVESTRALVPDAELRLGLLESQLNVLLGRPAGTAIRIETRTPPPMPPLPATGLPADLLAKRPDIQAGLLRLESRDWSVAAARADRLPTLTLGGSLSAADSDIGNVIDQWAGNLVAGLAAPLIDGGRRRAEVDFQKALAEEAVATYRSLVLNAVAEVNDALLSERKIAARRDMQQKQYEALSNQLDEAQLRYRRGLNDYLAVLNALAAKQGLERNLINSAMEVYTARIELHRALGGDWMAAAANQRAE